MTILSNIIGGAALAALFVVFYALGVSAGWKQRSSGKKISAWSIPTEVNTDD